MCVCVCVSVCMCVYRKNPESAYFHTFYQCMITPKKLNG